MYTFLLIIHVLVSIALAIVILMQSSKGGGLAGVFGGGGGGMGNVFGGRGVASFLSKLTTGLAIAFMVICLVLGKITSGGGGSQVQESAVQRARSSSVIPVYDPDASAGQSTPSATTPAPAQQEPGTEE